MKKQTRVLQLRLAIRERSRWEKSVRRRRSLDARRSRECLGFEGNTVRITPPAIFSFSRNYHETVACLQRLKTRALSRSSTGRYSKVLIDISQIEEISEPAALVLAAEIDRWRKRCGKRMRPDRVSEWSPRVRTMLHDLGFFDLLDVNRAYVDGLELDDKKLVTLLPMINKTTISQEKLSNLSAISEVLHGDPTIYGALVEAAYNVTKHAYPKEHDWRFPPVVKGWWATASLDAEAKRVKFIVYDQGVGISQTLPRWEGWESVRGLLAKLPLGVGEVIGDEAKMIKAALEVDRTSLKGGHGKGLQDVVQVVSEFEGASVRILSGKGSVLYRKSDDVELMDNTLHLGGTLVEWTIPVRSA